MENCTTAQLIDFNAARESLSGELAVHRRIMTFARDLGRVKELDELNEALLETAMDLCRADGGVIYLVENGDLAFSVVKCHRSKLNLGGITGDVIKFPAIPMRDPRSKMYNHQHACVHAAASARSVHIPDVYEESGFDFHGIRKMDGIRGFRTVSFLAQPLINSEDQVIAILQLSISVEGDGETEGFSPLLLRALADLASIAEIALQNRLNAGNEREFIDSVVKMIAKAIDAKSPHTSHHCQRVPVIYNMLAEAACARTSGPFAPFELNEDELYELNVAAWLHDCGKIAVPEYLMDKATKLEGLGDGVDIIATRFEIIKRDLIITFMKDMQQQPKDAKKLQAELAEKIEMISQQLEFIETLNLAGSTVDDEVKLRLSGIEDITWVDCQNEQQPLLSKAEIECLSIRQGTLTERERRQVQGHAALSIEMLEGLKLPENLRKVPEIAGAHHERMDGKGYPRGLHGQQMSIAARMLAVADIFEALTAVDRPYKRSKTLNQSIAIMADMRDNGHIDPQIFDLFLISEVYLKYARKFMPHQLIDQVDINNFLGDPDAVKDMAKDINFVNNSGITATAAAAE